MLTIAFKLFFLDFRMPFESGNIFTVTFVSLTGNLIKKWNQVSFPKSDFQQKHVT